MAEYCEGLFVLHLIIEANHIRQIPTPTPEIAKLFDEYT
jgi:hypothetical protein